MKMRPITLTTRSRAPFAFSTTDEPRPGVPGGEIDRPDQARLALDEHERLALIEGVIAERHRIDADGEEILEYGSRVSPKPPAAFSPLTTTKSSPQRARKMGTCSRTAARPDRPTTSPMNSKRIIAR